MERKNKIILIAVITGVLVISAILGVTLTGAAVAGGWSREGTGVVHPTNLGDKVGVGTSSLPSGWKMNVNGVLGVQKEIYSKSAIYSYSGSNYLGIRHDGSAKLFTTKGSPSKDIHISPGENTVMTIRSDGNVGIGLYANPTTELDVGGMIRTRSVNNKGACNSGTAGTIAYENTSATVGTFYGCAKTGEWIYAWVALH